MPARVWPWRSARPGRRARPNERKGWGELNEARLHALISGRVQGVGYRYFALDHGQRLRLRGWVRNLATGQVEVVAEGARADLEKLLCALRLGPGAARVSNVQVSWSEPHGDLGPFTLVPSA